jgi:ABC-type sugar transport system ATPase subunit
MVQITLQGVSRRFGTVIAVDRVDLEIADGSFTVLLGPSGCGKTTTLNMIAGLEEVSGGRILFDGEEIQDRPPHKRDIAMVFQSYALYPNRSVRENIAFPLRMSRVDKREIAARVADVAARLEIAELLNRHPKALSGGQQQRVALARAIVRRPRAFLLDEPLSNLDAKLRADMRIELKALQRQLNGTFILVTHDQAEAMSLADTLVVMNRGQVQQVGAPLAVYRRPTNLFVARFVGIPAMNLVEGEVGGGVFRGHGFEVPLRSGYGDGPRTLGFRSEGVRLEPASDGATGQVELVEQLGADALVAVATAAGVILAREHPDTRLEPGDGVRLVVDPAQAHLFATDTGIRLNPDDGVGHVDADGLAAMAQATAAMVHPPAARP